MLSVINWYGFNIVYTLLQGIKNAQVPNKLIKYLRNVALENDGHLSSS